MPLSPSAEISSLESSLSTLQDRYQDDLEAAPPGAVSALPQFSVNNRSKQSPKTLEFFIAINLTDLH